MAAERIVDLYWLAYLLTGDRERSAQAVIEALEMPDAANPFFAGWMSTWSRKIFIAKVLGYVIPESSVADLRARHKRLQAEVRRTGARRMDPAAGKAELERALLAIDPLPRRALLLNVFEKLAIEDIGILLNADRETVKTASAIGLIELARNLAGPRKSQAIGAAMASSMAAVQEMAI
jgi:DNA-directed RNA polymerase specialized sigma24 family protein